ncbi:MAG: hypothetical protein D3922_10965, partial [Candidatus Electrothrix sp. AR1]|nr:hypothetical protein [Candidatus Electrothrix sp. AR1]
YLKELREKAMNSFLDISNYILYNLRKVTAPAEAKHSASQTALCAYAQLIVIFLSAVNKKMSKADSEKRPLCIDKGRAIE